MKMLKKTVAILLAMVMMLSSLPVTAFAAEISSRSEETSSEASTDGGFQYTVLPDNTAEICGYTGEDDGDGEFLYIPETVGDLPVTALAQEAFANNDTLRGVFVPASITSIGNSAFYHCRQLEVVALADSPAFGITAFEGCTALRELLLPMGADMMTLSALLENDLSGQRVNMSQYADVEMIKAAFDAYNTDQPAAQADVAADAEAEAETGDAETGDTETASGTSAEGTCGDGLVWTLGEDGKLTISGTGKMADYSSGTAPWYEYREQITSLELSEGLTSIGSYAFTLCDRVTGTLEIPDSVISIGNSAFRNCTSLDGKLIIGVNVKAIGNYAFSGCSKLTGLALGDGITSIGNYTFNNCSGMKGDLVIPDSVTSIGSYAFYGCSGFDGTLTLSKALTSLESYAFQNCSSITGELVVPDMLTSLNKGIFSGMKNITSLVIGEGVTSIYTVTSSYYSSESDNAFYGMSGVTEVTFTGLTVPTITNTSRGPFASMTKLETVYVPAGAFDAYVSAYSKYVGSGVAFSSDTLHTKVGNLRTTWCGSKSVTLAWNPHANSAVIGYRIERDGVLLGTTDRCAFTDQQLTTGTAYTYTVCGYTADDIATAAAQLTVTPQAPKILDIKTGNSQNKLGADQSTVYIHVQDSKNLRPESGQTVAELYCLNNGQRQLIGQGTLSNSLSGTYTAVYTVDWDVSAMAEGSYEVVFCLTDADGTKTEYSKTLLVDHSRPAQIVGVTAISDVEVIYLTWAISSEVGTATYRIYRRAETDEDFRLIARINDRNTLTYTDKNVKSDHIYHYYVTGVNSLGRESEPSLIVGATLSLDEEAPRVTKLSPANGTYLTGTVTIGFTAEDNVSVTRGELYYSLDKWYELDAAGRGKIRTVQREAFDRRPA